MLKRMLIMLAVVFAFLAIIGSFKFFQIKAAMSKSYTPPPEAVTTIVAREQPWEKTLDSIGTVVAVHGVTVSADLPGVVDSITFDSGHAVNQGDVLVTLDTRQERAQLASAEAQADLAKLDLDRNAGLLKQQIIPQATYDTAAATYKSAVANADQIRATIERKTIRAQFSGVLGLRQVNLGQYLASSTPVVSLQALRPVYVNFSVPQQQLSQLTVGSSVGLTSDAISNPETGKISALDSVIDESTRNVGVQATFENRDGKLRPGMFVEGHFARGKQTNSVPRPVTSIAYAPFGDSVFIVEQMKGPGGKSYLGVRQQFVKLGASRGDQVEVLTGVKPGEEVVTSGAFKLRPGTAVVVNNSVQPGDSATPKPPDT